MSTQSPFGITPEEELHLRSQANKITPAAVITPASTFDAFTRQLMIPTAVMELARKSSTIHFAGWETEAIRASLKDGILKRILEIKAEDDKSHPPYIRVACAGKGDFDHLAGEFGIDETEADHHLGDFGSPVVLEIWPGGHYSPIHSHGTTSGIVYCLTGQVDVMAYKSLAWDAEKMALLTLTPGQCAWLTDKHFAVHKVHCPMAEGNFAATFHVYLNRDELPLLTSAPKPDTRDVFDYIDEDTPHAQKAFDTYSDLSWAVLRREMAKRAVD
jgi:hypothetical protein